MADVNSSFSISDCSNWPSYPSRTINSTTIISGTSIRFIPWSRSKKSRRVLSKICINSFEFVKILCDIIPIMEHWIIKYFILLVKLVSTLFLSIVKFSLFKWIIWNRKILFFWFHSVAFAFAFLGIKQIYLKKDIITVYNILFCQTISGIPFPDWYFSRIGRMQRLLLLSKLNPTIQNVTLFRPTLFGRTRS